MTELGSNIDPKLWEAVREGLADATGIHPDFLADNDVDVETMYLHVHDMIVADIAKIVAALNAVGLSYEQKKFVESYLERFSIPSPTE